MAKSTNDILPRLRHHIAWMAPHQKKREVGKLLIDAANEIEQLRKAYSAMGDAVGNFLQSETKCLNQITKS